MATIIKEWKRKEEGYEYRTLNDTDIWVANFDEGVAEFKFEYGTSIQDVAVLVEGCFNPVSNFEEYLHVTFERAEKLKEIQFDFNGFLVRITADNSNRVVSEYRRTCEEEA